MSDPASRIPASLAAALRPLAAVAEGSRPNDLGAVPIIEQWRVPIDRRGLPVLVAPSGPIGTVLLVDAARAVAVTPRGWVRLGAHADGLGEHERAAELRDLEAVCEALRAVLAGSAP